MLTHIRRANCSTLTLVCLDTCWPQLGSELVLMPTQRPPALPASTTSSPTVSQPCAWMCFHGAGWGLEGSSCGSFPFPSCTVPRCWAKASPRTWVREAGEPVGGRWSSWDTAVLRAGKQEQSGTSWAAPLGLGELPWFSSYPRERTGGVWGDLGALPFASLQPWGTATVHPGSAGGTRGGLQSDLRGQCEVCGMGCQASHVPFPRFPQPGWVLGWLGHRAAPACGSLWWSQPGPGQLL